MASRLRGSALNSHSFKQGFPGASERIKTKAAHLVCTLTTTLYSSAVGLTLGIGSLMQKLSGSTRSIQPHSYDFTRQIVGAVL